MKKTIIGILTLSIIGIIACISNNATNTSALTYTEDVELEFTFNPSLSVSLSSSDLVINDLVPGTSSDSNVIDVNVVTNNISGYSLSSTVGNSTDSNPSHNTTNLVHSSNASAASDGLVFTSLSPSDSLADLASFSPNTWGYSYSLDNGTNWSNYSGLPLYSSPGTTLSEKYVPSDDTIDFKIAAYASTTETAGAYTNKINFTATAFPSPLTLEQSYAYFNKTKVGNYYTMQDMEPRICAVANELSEMQVIDIRDNNIYTIAKLADGRCWMTTNLNLEGGTQLSSEDTDMAEDWVMPVANGFQEGNRLPESSTEGFSDSATAYLYNSHRNTPEDCSTAPGCYSYYSWITATVGSGLNISTDNTDAPYSVCPKNWHLPSTYYGTNSNTDFRALIIALGGSSMHWDYTDHSEPTGGALYNSLNISPYNFHRAGFYSYGAFSYSGLGKYWSSTASLETTSARQLYFYTTGVYLSYSDPRRMGNSTRCITND